MQEYVEGQKVWSNILSSFKSQISAGAFKTWFSGSYVVDFKKTGDRNLLVVGVPNNFILEQLETRYMPTISKTANEKGLGTEVVFVVSQRATEKQVKNEPIFSGIASGVVPTKRGDVLSPSYTFDNFVVGFSNNIAFFAAQQICANLGKTYNPLLFWGPTGVGKTHLLQAIGQEVLSKYQDIKVLYVPAEKFTNDFIESLSNKTQQAFRQKYRSCHLLLVDDVQFFAGKESTQDEFFYTFNDLYLSGRQVVLASDRHPKELSRLNERLVSRFLGGMPANISLPDLEMKVAILRAKSKERGVHLDDEITAYIARKCLGGARELEGLLISVLAMHKLSGGQISVSDVATALESTRPATLDFALTPGKIMDTVSRYFKLGIGDIRSESRKAPVVWARQILMYLLRSELGLPLEAIGEFVGGRDHSTVIHGIAKIEEVALSSQSKKDELLRVRALINKNS